MSSCFVCNIDSNLISRSNRITRGANYVYFAQGLQSIVSVVEYPNQDSAHYNTKTNNYLTYRINGFRYKIYLKSDVNVRNDDSIYIVFFKVKIVDDITINLTQLKNNGDFSDFVLYKQPNDVLHYRCVKPHENYDSYSQHTREINGFCNKSFLVKPDDVFGVYYLSLGGGDVTYYIEGTVSVYFDVV